jgi:hypothetical protein
VNEVQLEAKHSKARTMVEYGNRGPSGDCDLCIEAAGK